jgi:hypothetical protein
MHHWNCHGSKHLTGGIQSPTLKIKEEGIVSMDSTDVSPLCLFSDFSSFFPPNAHRLLDGRRETIEGSLDKFRLQLGPFCDLRSKAVVWKIFQPSAVPLTRLIVLLVNLFVWLLVRITSCSSQNMISIISWSMPRVYPVSRHLVLLTTLFASNGRVQQNLWDKNVSRWQVQCLNLLLRKKFEPQTGWIKIYWS